MKRGTLRKMLHSKGRVSHPLIIRVSVNGGTSEPMRVRNSSDVPKVGEVFEAHPTSQRLARTAKMYRVLSIENQDGVQVHVVEPVIREPQ
jgi:hypothetical protein